MMTDFIISRGARASLATLVRLIGNCGGGEMTGGSSALDCARKPGFDPVAGEDQAADRRGDTRAGRLAGRERERRALLADDGAALQDGVARAGNRGGDLARGEGDERRIVGGGQR